MFFNKSLQKENQQLKEDLHSWVQIRESLDEDMLRITLDPKVLLFRSMRVLRTSWA